MAAVGGMPEVRQGFMVNLSAITGSQTWLDITGPAEAIRSDKWRLLYACIIIDLIGMASYLIFLIGEVGDLMWAPIAGFLLQYFFGSLLVSSLGALEEFLPFTDILPTATLAWAICHVESLNFLRLLLGIQRHGPREDATNGAPAARPQSEHQD
ncbi:Uncharacterized protein SCF082_LOCUS2786 [Durusdinium trenchii]|uniref:Uncharacterized protein n=1 Tax=Durusdinium trenchii TaxID=1381693 RepID=A0ABP0HRH1_9DINO